MTKGLRITLWSLSSLAVLWTIIALVGVFTVGRGGMMNGGMMGSSGMAGGMHASGSMGSGLVAGMMVHMALTWLVMLGLVGVFVYLAVTARRTA